MKRAGAIVVLDCGGQYAHLIASRMRRLGVRSEIRPADAEPGTFAGAAGVVISGGPRSVYEEGSPQPDRRIFDLHIPVLGLCYGHQWIARALGGDVRGGKGKEYGHTEIDVTEPSGLLRGVPQKFVAWMSHGDEVTRLPDGFARIARSHDCPNAAMADEKRRIFGLQFHAEVAHTENGTDILRRFADICEPASWSVQGYAARIEEDIRAQVKDRNVFMLVSGGVDSTVAFTLLNRILGSDRVFGLLVDTGLMRKGEVDYIRGALGALGFPNLHVEDAADLFFERLRNVFDPEEKRRAIGEAFLAVQANVAGRLGLDGPRWLLGQGTIYPDTIETGGTRHADRIKTHHNRVGAIQKLLDEGRVVEPLKELYKDEVRVLGEELGLPRDLVWRQPFPGPGLGVRILCTDAKEKSQSPNPNHQIFVPHAVLPVRSVGVQGDGRTYRQAVVLFSSSKLATDEHRKLATEIPNTVPAFNRVLFCTSHGCPAQYVLTPAFVTRERADLLREADAIVHEEVSAAGLTERIWQFPVVLLPVGIRDGGQAIVLRPVESTDAMTATAARLPDVLILRITERLLELPGIDLVFQDLTNKPPATIEWE